MGSTPTAITIVMTLLEPGIHFNVPVDQYRADPGYNQSALKRFGMASTPAHYKWEKDHPTLQDKDYIRIGRFVDHCLMGDETQFPFVAWSVGRRAGKEWDAFKLKNEDKTILSDEETARGVQASAALLEHEDAASALKISDHQVVIIATHPHFGYRLKGCIDLLPKKDINWVWDIKTAASASEQGFFRQAGNIGYDIQAEFYLALLEYSGRPTHNFGFFVVENDAPFGVNSFYFKAGDPELQVARSKIDSWLPAYHKCVTEDKWPSYDTAWKKIRFKPWQLRGEQPGERLE